MNYTFVIEYRILINGKPNIAVCFSYMAKIFVQGENI